ncbi:tripartite tricarboxylate transporter substrate binding protein [Pseudoruegeria sp. HB172150]|uniref:Bug family tripartite tricarboxylate transporter substrate binding protein n=1 Tax=Pseudoruegeria sp. HB172150 TaxID=2721164 RepID=UPI0015565A2F|nr:tripartite tricarboxylate transporter substrate binding protein [Pseudoruegeria sp. HB172150]
MKLVRRTVLAASLGLGALAAIPAAAQEDYPTKAINVIVPFGAGGGFDQMVRALQPVLEEKLGVPLAIRNTPGAGGRRGSIELMRSDNDGYTIGLSYFVPFLTDECVLSKEPAIDIHEFDVIYRTTHDSHFLIVKADSDIETLEGMAGSDGPVRFSTTGIGSSAWVGGNVLGSLTGFEPAFVGGYKTLGEANLAVARGDVDASIGGIPHFGGMRDDVRPLVYLGGERNPEYPDVPTAAELGYPDTALLGGIHIFSAPPGTDEAKLETLREAFRAAVEDDGFKEWAKANTTQITPGEPADAYEQADAICSLYKGLDLDVEG